MGAASATAVVVATVALSAESIRTDQASPALKGRRLELRKSSKTVKHRTETKHVGQAVFMDDIECPQLVQHPQYGVHGTGPLLIMVRLMKPKARDIILIMF